MSDSTEQHNAQEQEESKKAEAQDESGDNAEVVEEANKLSTSSIAPASPESDAEPVTSDSLDAPEVKSPSAVFPAASAAAMGPAIPVDVKPVQAVESASTASADSDAGDSDGSEEEGSEEEEPSGPQSSFGPLSEEQQAYPWYVVNTYSGFEMNAKKNLEERIRANDLIDRFGQVLIPQETVVELVRGQKKTSTRKFFPGYMLVQCDLDDETWHLVNGTPKVTGFVGDPRNPSPLAPHEVENLLKQMEGGAARPRPKVQFEQGDAIKVIDGPFTDFNGTVDEVRPDKGKLRVLISIFGRNTPVELDFVQVEKA